MKEICQYAEQYYLQNGISPSTTKIAEEVGRKSNGNVQVVFDKKFFVLRRFR